MRRETGEGRIVAAVSFIGYFVLYLTSHEMYVLVQSVIFVVLEKDKEKAPHQSMGRD